MARSTARSSPRSSATCAPAPPAAAAPAPVAPRAARSSMSDSGAAGPAAARAARIAALAVVLLALVCRLALVPRMAVLQADGCYYLWIAEDLRRGDLGAALADPKPPLYPALIAATSVAGVPL